MNKLTDRLEELVDLEIDCIKYNRHADRIAADLMYTEFDIEFAQLQARVESASVIIKALIKAGYGLLYATSSPDPDEWKATRLEWHDVVSRAIKSEYYEPTAESTETGERAGDSEGSEG